jgi:hypothetical protein
VAPLGMSSRFGATISSSSSGRRAVEQGSKVQDPRVVR